MIYSRMIIKRFFSSEGAKSTKKKDKERVLTTEIIEFTERIEEFLRTFQQVGTMVFL
jgi:intein/homing endonuclease